jgi:hypothetical protein
MTDEMRELLTDHVSDTNDGENYVPILEEEYYYKVLTIDGQELSSRNQRIMHAIVDWDRGFRKDKSVSDCTLDLKTVKETMF